MAQFARANFDYEGEEDDELSFPKDAIITVTSTDEPGEGWITGTLDGNEGIFPSNYVAFVVAKGAHDFAGEDDDELTF
eukprot:SAG22_NODE_19270_length_276_cov_0.864407_1_plen_77_part_01